MEKMRFRRNTLLLVSVLCLFFATACQTPGGRTAGQVVDDGAITTKVKAKLFQDPLLSGIAISVETFQGEVTLTGAVDSETARRRAANLAGSVNGVREVNNLLKVK